MEETSEDERPRKKPRLSMNRRQDVSGKPVRILVSAQEEVIYEHKGLLRTSSPYFDRSLEPRWQGSGDKIVRLPDEEYTIVELYIRWLYFDNLPTPSPETWDTLRRGDMNQVKAWIFADKVLDNGFHDAVIHAFIKRIGTSTNDNRYHLFDPDAVRYTFENTIKGASIRRLIVDLYCRLAHEEVMSVWEDEDIPFDFVLELAQELAKRTPIPEIFHMSDYLRADQQE